MAEVVFGLPNTEIKLGSMRCKDKISLSIWAKEILLDSAGLYLTHACDGHIPVDNGKHVYGNNWYSRITYSDISNGVYIALFLWLVTIMVASLTLSDKSPPNQSTSQLTSQPTTH